ncbi:hypothetical protein K2Q00_00860 [Patescibacteria group bacterium]|nr:hypothetical protein [Patescibacteria group bacterium]
MSQKIIWKVLRMSLWAPLALCLFFMVLVLLRIPVRVDKKNTEKSVANIQAQHITVGDVLGNNLPPIPNQTQNSATLLGIDANKNNIRDDIELAIFATATNARVRAAELQYAFAKQMALTSVFNSDTWVAFAIQESRGFQCLGQALRRAGVAEDDRISRVVARTEEITALTLDTQLRRDVYERNMKFMTGYVLDRSHVCDVDLGTLPN